MTRRVARRDFLTLAGATVGLLRETVAGAAPTARERPTFILVHGAWHSSYCWCEVANQLRADGFRVIALDLPGHGLHARYPASYFTEGQSGFATEPSPLSGVTLNAAANAVIAALDRARGQTKPILVGHSLEGTIITRAAESAPELIGRLVYLTAFLPTLHPSPAALYELPEARTPYDAPLTVGEAARIGAIRFNPRGNIAYLRQLHSVFYHDVSEEQFLPFAAAMSPDLPLRLWTEEPQASAARWGSLKRTYIHCTEDHAIAPTLQLKMIADADRLTPENRTDVIEMASSHSPFASQVDRLTALMRRVAQNG
jgi:pimeloyl-ACP methyl ester carboxylesterase